MDRSARWSSMWVVVAAALALAGCGPGSFQGTVNGLVLDVKDSIFVVDRNSSGQIVFMSAVLSDQPGRCDALKARRTLANGILLFITLIQEDQDSNNITPTPGSFLVQDSSVAKHALPTLEQTDAACQISQYEVGRDGSATLDAYRAEPGGSMRGSFDFTFEPRGDQAKGTFDARFCDATDTAAIGWAYSGCR